MKKSTGLLLAFLLLGFGAYFLLNKKDNTSDGYDFAIENTDQIYKVELIHKKTNIVLERVDKTTWKTGKHIARQESIDLLLETFRRLHIKERVPIAAEKNVMKRLKENGILAKAYDKSGNLIKSMYVGSSSPGKQGTYMMLEGAEHPFDINIMGWEGVLRPRFMLDPEDWRDKSVFHASKEDVETITVKYFLKKDQNSSFKVEKGKNKDEYSVTRLLGDSKADAVPEKGKVLFFLKAFENIGAEAFETNNPKRDSVVQEIPFCEIELQKTNGNKRNVKFYPVPGPQVGFKPDGSIKRGELERYYANINNNQDFMLVQHRVFRKLFPPYEFFYSKE